MGVYGPIISVMIEDSRVELYEDGKLRVHATGLGSQLELSPAMMAVLYKFFNRVDVGAWLPDLDDEIEEDEF